MHEYAGLTDVTKQIETIYPGLTKQRGKVLNYIGMTFDFSKEGCVKMTMGGFVQDLVEGCKDMPGTANTPARANLFTVPDESDCQTNHQRSYVCCIVADIVV